MTARPPLALFAHNYRPTLAQVLGAIVEAVEYEAERVALEIELFGCANDVAADLLAA